MLFQGKKNISWAIIIINFFLSIERSNISLDLSKGIG